MDNSPLNKLPAELRNRIYELSLTHDTPYIIFTTDGHRAASETKASFGLTATCKAIRAETILLFYSLNRFVFKGAYWVEPTYGQPYRRDGSIPAYQSFMSSIGAENAAALRSIRIELREMYPLTWSPDRYPIAGVMRIMASQAMKRLEGCRFRVAGDLGSHGLGGKMAFELDPGDMARSFEHLRASIIEKRTVSNFQMVADLLDGLEKLESLARS